MYFYNLTFIVCAVEISNVITVVLLSIALSIYIYGIWEHYRRRLRNRDRKLTFVPHLRRIL